MIPAERHYLAGRMSQRPSPGYDPVVVFCTCGLAFFSHEGFDAADALWRAHREVVTQ